MIDAFDVSSRVAPHQNYVPDSTDTWTLAKLKFPDGSTARTPAR